MSLVFVASCVVTYQGLKSNSLADLRVLKMVWSHSGHRMVTGLIELVENGSWQKLCI